MNENEKLRLLAAAAFLDVGQTLNVSRTEEGFSYAVVPTLPWDQITRQIEQNNALLQCVVSETKAEEKESGASDER